MISESVIDPRTVQAYRETHFSAYPDPDCSPVVLQVGVVNAQLDKLHQAHQVTCSAFVTACNPYSEACSDHANFQRQRDLRQALAVRGLTFFPGVGEHPSGDWPGEPSFLVLGIDLQAAKSLGAHWQQNAIVWAGRDAIPQLVLLR